MQVKGGTEGVGPGQERSVLVADINRERRLDTEDVGQRVPIGQHHALGVPGGPRGVDERVQSKRVVGDLEVFGLPPFRNESRPAVDGHAFRWQLVGLVFAQQKHAASGPSTGIGRHVGHQFVKHRSIGYRQESGGGIVEDVRPFLAVLVRVHGGVGCPDAVSTVGKGGPFDGVVEDQGDTVTGFHTHGSELAAHRGRQFTEIPVGHVRTRHPRSGDVAEGVSVTKSADAGHQHLVQGSRIIAFGFLPLAVVGLSLPCHFVGLHGCGWLH